MVICVWRRSRSPGVNVSVIQRQARMMNGICEKARELLKEAQGPLTIFDTRRQIEAAELMIGHNNFGRLRLPLDDLNDGRHVDISA